MKSIGKYQVIDQLGTSAAGATYRVRDSFRNREFALKLLKTVPSLNTAGKDRFCAHLASCADLVQRNLVKVLDLGEVEEGLFIVSELRTGMDFQQYMQENRELPLGQKLALVAQVAEGLAFAHSREIPHGDLKPSNVFVDGERDITILDFGTARWLAALLEAGSRPEDLVVNYLAPEQILGEPFNARSDIFALGLMLYEFVSGKYPFSAPPGLIPREIVHSDAPPLRSLDSQIPEELNQLVQRALQKDPAERLQTAEEFAAGLYLAAQELRRRAAAAPPAPPAEPVSPPPVARVMPAPEPVVVSASILEATLAAPIDVSPEPLPRAPQPRVRDRPQDETGPPQAWTARSYSANASFSRETAFSRQQSPPEQEQPTVPPGPPISVEAPPGMVAPAQAPPIIAAPPPVPAPPRNLTPPGGTPPVRRQTPAQPLRTDQNKKLTKRAIVIVVGLVLAVIIVGSLISRQRLRAAPDKPPAATMAAPPHVSAAPANPTAAPQTSAAPKPGESGPDDLGNPEFSARQTLHGPVRSLWESGRYAEALALVNQVLVNNPNNAEARAWKKKVRDAQEAEAALK